MENRLEEFRGVLLLCNPSLIDALCANHSTLLLTLESLISLKKNEGIAGGLHFQDSTPKTKSSDEETSGDVYEDEDVHKLLQSRQTKLKTNPYLDVYFRKIEIFKKAINEIEKNVVRLKSLKNKAVQAADSDSEKDVSQHLNKLLDTTLAMIRETKKALDAFRQEQEEAVKKTPSLEAQSQMCANILLALSKRFEAIIKEYQAVQNEYKKEVKVKIGRQIRFVYPEASEDEITNISNGDVSHVSMAVKQRFAVGHHALRNALNEVQDKYRDVLRIEKSMAELHQLFVDVATLVEYQGELIEQIEFSVNSAKEMTASAQTKLVGARKAQLVTKKRLIWFLSIFGIVVLIVALMVTLI